MKSVSLLVSSQAGTTLNCLQVALFGEFFSRDLKPILNRITLHSESSHPMHLREIVFEPFDAQQLRERGNEPVILRAKKELGEPDSGWCAGCIIVMTGKLTICRILYSYLKPESVRAHPEATVRPWATCQVIGDALSFACALGYV
jgi:mediator of RNA polymerase II transcription subunit 18